MGSEPVPPWLALPLTLLVPVSPFIGLWIGQKLSEWADKGPRWSDDSAADPDEGEGKRG